MPKLYNQLCNAESVPSEKWWVVAFCVPANSNGTSPSSAKALRDVALLQLGDKRLQPELVQDQAVAVHPVRPLQAELVALAVGVIYLRIQVPELP